MSDEDDFDYTTTTKSSGNLATIFHGGEPASTIPVATTAYVPPKQPKKDSAPKVMIATLVQTFSFGADQKWIQKGKMGVALLSTDNTIFQLIIYVSKTQQITSVRINTSTVFTAQSNNYLSFQDDGGQNWSLMFDTKEAIIAFALQLLLAKAYLFSFKFDHIIQDIREGEGSALVDGDGVEITVNPYKFLENGTIQATDPGESKPVKFKIGKNQNGKAFDDVLRGMKKGGQRVAIVGATFYSIEVIRIKKEKEGRSSSVTMPAEEPVPVEQKRAVADQHDHDKEKNDMLRRLGRMGAVSMMHNPSAFVTTHPHHLSDDDSINNEFIQNIGPARTVSTPVPPVQFVPAGYPHPHHLHHQPLIQQANLYQPLQQQTPQPLHDYNPRPGSSMGGMPYQQVQMWPSPQYPPPTPNVPPADMFYQQQQQQQQQQAFQPDFRQLLNRLNEKVDSLNEKFDTKNSTIYPNMETSILLSNIQRIVKENESMKKDLFDRSAKVEELNSKISELLDRNQRLIEKSHQTAEQRNDVVNNVSEQTAQKILELEKQKVELTNDLSLSTSKISDLQLQLNQYTHDTNENQSRVSSLTQKCEQYKNDFQKSESQRLELQTKVETIQEQYKNEKLARKQLQNNLSTLEEELAELKIISANFDKVTNERKSKYENERKRWQDDIEEQKQSYEKELDELRAKLRKQRTADSQLNNQELTRIEQELAKEWQEKLGRQQTQHERLLNAKEEEIEQLKTSLDENETKLLETIAELDESKVQIEAYEERCQKLQERILLMKEKLVEMNNEQTELINDQVKQTVNIIFQRLKTQIQPTKQYTGEQVLSRSLEIIKKATLKVLSNNDEDEPSDDDVQSEEENEKDDQPTNGNSVDQQTLREEVSSVQTKLEESETLLTANNQKNGWDIVDDIQQETKEQNQVVVIPEDSTSTANENEIIEQNQVIITTEESTSTVNEIETASNPVIETNEPVLSSKTDKEGAEEHDSDGNVDAIEEKDEKPSSSTVLVLPKEKSSSDDDDPALFRSARPSAQDNVSTSSATQSSASSTNKFKPKNPLSNPDDSDDELFK